MMIVIDHRHDLWSSVTEPDIVGIDEVEPMREKTADAVKTEAYGIKDIAFGKIKLTDNRR